MQTIASKLDMLGILESIKILTYKSDSGNVEMAITQSGGLPKEILDRPAIKAAVEEISKIRNLQPVNLMINILRAGNVSPVHQDWIKPTPLQQIQPTIERWHLAVATNEFSFWWDSKNLFVRFPIKHWSGPVPYWNKHAVTNHGPSDRIHLIVDLDTPERQGEYE